MIPNKKHKKEQPFIPNKRQITIVVTTIILLLIPLVAMQFTNEVNWTALDFIVAGTLFLSTGFVCELTLRKIPKTKYRIAICALMLLLLLLIWAELAVGIFGSPISGT